MPRTNIREVSKERLLIYGGPGVGKTYAILSLLRLYPKSKVFVIDVDDGASTTAEEFEDLDEDRLFYFKCKNFAEVIEDWNIIEEEIEPDDWICLDMLGQFWELAQQDYVKEIWGKDIGEYYKQMRKDAEDAKKQNKQVNLSGWEDWSIIKKSHNSDFIEKIKRCGSRVLLTAGSKTLITSGRAADGPAIVSVFGKVGQKPVGEKHNPHRVHTILFLEKDSKGDYYVTCLKNRGKSAFEKTLVPDGESALDVWMEES